MGINTKMEPTYNTRSQTLRHSEEVSASSRGCSSTRSKTVSLNSSGKTKKHNVKSSKHSDEYIVALDEEAEPNLSRVHANLTTLFERLRLTDSNREGVDGKASTGNSGSILSLTAANKYEIQSSNATTSGTISIQNSSILVAVQCQALTATGARCTRKVRGDYCYQHRVATKETHPKSFYTADNQLIEFSVYIQDHLHPETQKALRKEMQKPTSVSDEPGYIYTLAYSDANTPDIVVIKVGRSTDPVRRLISWGDCKSGKPVWIGCYPGKVVPCEKGLYGGRRVSAPAGTHCHRVERLVHLELEDLALNTYYLEEEWPNVVRNWDAKKIRRAKDEDRQCMNCGKEHREFFVFRIANGNQQVVFDLVAKIIKKWSKYVQKHAR